METDLPGIAAAIGSWAAPMSGVVGVVVGHWLNSGRSRKEKITDLRRAAYGAILSELAAAERFYGAIVESINEDAERYHGSDVHGFHFDNLHKHMGAARQRFVDDYLILSDDFVSLFEKMLKDRSDKDDETDPFGNAQVDRKIVRAARPELLAIARREVR